MKTGIGLILAITVLASGCSQLQDSSSPREKFNNLVEKRESSTYNVKYDISSPGLGDLGKIFSGSQVEIYNRGKRSKTVIESNFLGSPTVSAIYRIGDSKIKCEEGGIGYEGISCSKDEEPTQGLPKANKYKINSINQTGVKKIAGRKCTLFSVNPNSTEETSLNTETDSASLEVCLDNRKGYMALMNITSKESSELTGRSKRTVLSIRATGYSGKVKQEQVEIPLEIGTSFSCRSNPEIAITPFKSINKVRVQFKGENKTVKLGDRFEKSEVSISEEMIDAGKNKAKIFTGEKAVETACTTYIGGSIGYPETETSEAVLDDYTEVDGRLENADFSEYTKKSGDADFTSWKELDGNTHHIGVKENGLDEASAGLSYQKNAIDVASASVTQKVNLSEIKAVGIDVKGRGSYSHRSNIVLEVNGQNQGAFVKSPSAEIYRDLGVKLNREFRGKNNLIIKWEHNSGDNLGSSMIDNVELYK